MESLGPEYFEIIGASVRLHIKCVSVQTFLSLTGSYFIFMLVLISYQGISL